MKEIAENLILLEYRRYPYELRDSGEENECYHVLSPSIQLLFSPSRHRCRARLCMDSSCVALAEEKSSIDYLFDNAIIVSLLSPISFFSSVPEFRCSFIFLPSLPSLLVFRTKTLLNIAVKFARMDHVFRVDNCSALVVVHCCWLLLVVLVYDLVWPCCPPHARKRQKKPKRETRMKRTRAKEATYARWQG